MDKTDFGDRMKHYEGIEGQRKLIPMLPICVRLDGKNFSKYTKKMQRPYDKRLAKLFIETTQFLVEETNAVIGYTQSDEISLILYSKTFKSQTYLNGRIQKLTSIISSMATAFFNEKIKITIPKQNQLAFFDCRVWNVPNKLEATNAILWREQDATKNSISMLASHHFSHKELHKKNSKDKLDMLRQKGINWNDCPSFFKRGSFIQKRIVKNKLTEKQLKELPLQHNARKNPDLEIERTEIGLLDMPIFTKVINRIDVVFNGAKPIFEL